ncbi:hypothetical protein [Flavobacterium sp. NRK F7]|uniref:hypothetical protein n=1 Tax=Flavobacterium sp. NRK F7 TaxID=2954930 RepID=UPI0020918BD9|nr:hypothetical protein [Flavobacterium sp. NRK F7]MCO6162304.1 hypothetical protein [Flavobacterium sp. NRK F7]
MEPNRLDTKIREGLGSREIKPTDQAWDRLDAMLSLAEKKEPKKGFGIYQYIAIAASFLLFISLGFWLYQANVNNSLDIPIQPKNNVVIEEKKLDNEEIIDNNVLEHYKEQDKIFQEENVVVEVPLQKQVRKEIDNNSTINLNRIEVTTVAEVDAKNKIQEISVIEKTTNKYVTGEMMLAAVENRPLEKKETLNTEMQTKIRVNTSNLLTTVEKELDENHKETTLDKLSRNFKQVKSALANRNYEE